ncbi:MucB/RseB C-terminal domain-containing protein [Succinivibrio dextrinosolvens]|jgi:negative regulator of sigma E activity|uniref:Sigma E regulatory protein, MucB/RseB n=1 Tax=Succinivibrio dextrinosolvens DSM 3072 TaxID=1123324 RepID=A0A1T4VFV1_9GAMM|nr:MucB/RseB C-terminal domain-containing protein [Succinivibrio dextrinosolvens]MBE6423976.1 hypothetical protein [Succinivibrio dextrinosolvens]MBQ3679374.1 MucB/RseB C-terminal domain-containing protein [Succinivibrio sp.]SKA63797.1 sigma E regulatory protein, MucB/RseB [Succinivibrio dextrinosolvens DSM 3072]
MKRLFEITAGVVCTAVFLFINTASASDVEQCELDFNSLKDTYVNSNIEATVIQSAQSEMEPLSLVHLNKNGIPYTTWKSLNNEVSGYSIRKNKGFDYNQNRGFVGPLIWHQTLIWDKIFSNESNLNGYDCSILGRTRLAGRKVTVLRLSPVDEIRYGFIVSKDADTNLPVELAVISPNQSVVAKFTVTAVHSTAALNLSFPDETFDRIEKMSKVEESSPTAWSELVIPTNFSIKRQGEEESSEGNKISYQIFSDGIVEFKVYKNNKSSLNIVSATDGTLSVMRKNSKFNEYAVVGEIPLDLCSLILSKITENR